MQMRILFRKQLHSTFSSISSSDVFLGYEMEMPFVPPVGMEVIDGEWSDTVESLVYKDGTVFAFTPPDKTFYNVREALRTASPEEMEELVAGYLDEGWHVVESGFLSA